MTATIRSRSDKSIGDTLEAKWKIVAKRVVAEPTPRTPYDPPRLGIYDYDVVPGVASAAAASIPDNARRQPPIVSFRRVNQ